jgi:sugar transferase (PEP-CTERM system associated)
MMIRLFRVSIPSSVLALVLSESILIFSCYLLAAYNTLDTSPEVFLWDDAGLWRIALVTALIQMGLYFSDLYENYRIRSRIALLQQYSVVIGVAFLSQALLSYGRWDIILPKWMMVTGSVLVMILVPMWRIIFTHTVWKAMGAQRLLFVGTSPAVQEIIGRVLERPELGMVPVGFLEGADSAGMAKDVLRLGAADDLIDVTNRLQPDRIVVGMSERRGQLPVHDLLQLRFAGVHIEEASTVYEAIFGRVLTRELHPSQLVFSGELGPKPAMVSLQAFYSLLFGLIVFTIALPVMFIVGLLVRFTSAGPILYSQTRVGLNGKTFRLYKFRSMRRDAEAVSGAVWATKDDPRITPVGRWLRKARLDELPQLLNVLRGEMSLVGPRPERPEFVNVLREKIPYYEHRHCVRPGVTGWAQINHKYGDTMDDVVVKLEYDLYYIKNLAPSLDLYIIFHTIKTVLLGRGAQ